MFLFHHLYQQIWLIIFKFILISLQIIGYDPITTEAEAKAAGIEKLTLEEIWPLADYITVHTPLIPATRSELAQQISQTRL